MIWKSKNRLRRVLYFSRQFGLDPISLIASLMGSGKFVSSYIKFSLTTMKSEHHQFPIKLSPVLKDYRESAGVADGHYFWQDLICAQWINQRNPDRHLDVASRIDGFIAHLLAFRKVTILDIRPLKAEIPNLEVILGDAQKELPKSAREFSSVSSLHSIEHFGLGRYGDKLDIAGHEIGLQNIAASVSRGGTLYLSFPIGNPVVEFNAQRIIHPTWPLKLLKDFVLEEFVLIPWKGEPTFGLSPTDVDLNAWGQAGLYRFIRNS